MKNIFKFMMKLELESTMAKCFTNQFTNIILYTFQKTKDQNIRQQGRKCKYNITLKHIQNFSS